MRMEVEDYLRGRKDWLFWPKPWLQHKWYMWYFHYDESISSREGCRDSTEAFPERT